MSGKVVFLTGGDSGIGYETALALAGVNASVIIANHDTEKGSAAVANITRLTGNADVEAMHLDLASFRSTHEVAAAVLAKHRVIDVVINDAGVYVSKPCLTEDGFECTMQINYLGHFLLEQLLLPALRASDNGRLIHVGSGSDIDTDPCGSAKSGCTDLDKLPDIVKAPASVGDNYGLSKFMMLFNGKELSKREAARGSKVRGYTIMPGLVDTKMNSGLTPEEAKEWCSPPECWAGWRDGQCDTPCPMPASAGGCSPTHLAVTELPLDAGALYFFCKPNATYVPEWGDAEANQAKLYDLSMDWTKYSPAETI